MSETMTEYERLREEYKGASAAYYGYKDGFTPERTAKWMDDARAALDAHVARLVEALNEIAALHDHHVISLDGCGVANDMGHAARRALRGDQP